jgi:hypothetical protein
MSRRPKSGHSVAAVGAAALTATYVVEHQVPLPARTGEVVDTAAMLSAPTTEPRPLRPWRQIEGKEWQLIAAAPEGDAGDDDAGPRGQCPPGMVEAAGSMKLDGPRGTVEDLQALACSAWSDHPEPGSCSAFDAARWVALSRDLPVRTMRYCIDRFEYPDRNGEYPVVMVTWREAAKHCADAGKRLCTEDEFTFACEGPEARPYSGGYVRDAQACVIDRTWRAVDFNAFGVREGARIERELDELWQGEPAGSHPGCVSPFGAYDMTGNVDEWTITSRSKGLASILKGGYWGPIHARCRSSTRSHNEDFYFYQIGFRCCGSLPAP